ncbi:SRPBCC family protein [Histidinibacterium lentulum]|nr:SRPBCC family protein [Histidinibacterium lentulum]
MDDFDIDLRAPVTATATRVLLAPPEQVWRTLSDLTDWPRWNRAIEGLWMAGPLAHGQYFEWRTEGWFIRSTLRLVDPPRRLGWTGRSPGTRSAHVLDIEPAGSGPEHGTRVTSRASLGGMMPLLFRTGMRRRLAVALAADLEALAQEIEPRPPRRQAA